MTMLGNKPSYSEARPCGVRGTPIGAKILAGDELESATAAKALDIGICASSYGE